MLVAQDAEQNQVRGLLDRARAGRAAVLELVGEPGIGKTALLAQARRMATGFDVAELVGLPAEQTTPYAGLADLVGQCRAAPASILRRTVGLDALDGRPVNELAVGIALIDLLASRDGVPLLLCVDDAQWLDPETRRPLGFAVRRLDDRFQGVRRRVALTGVLKGAQDRRAYPTPNRRFAWTPTWTPLRPHSMPVPTTC